jgi:hypothetical protein
LNRHYRIANKEMFDMFASPSSSSSSMCSAADCGGATRARAEEERLKSLRVLRGMGRGTEQGEGSDSVAEGNYGSEEFFTWVDVPRTAFSYPGLVVRDPVMGHPASQLQGCP